MIPQTMPLRLMPFSRNSSFLMRFSKNKNKEKNPQSRKRLLQILPILWLSSSCFCVHRQWKNKVGNYLLVLNIK